MQLNRLGWCDFFAHSFSSDATQGYSVGRVAIAHRDQYQLYTEQGERTATITGKFRHQTHASQDFPVVGDWVIIDPKAEPTLIHGVLPRRSQFSRQTPGSRTEAQIIATNIDTVFLVSGLDHDFNLRRIERYLVMAWDSGATPVIILNKADLCDDLEAKLTAVEEIAIGVAIFALSALHRENLDGLAPYLELGKTIALLGSSGVGKSTLTNQLMGREVQTTQSVREDDSRGRHTTTSREMLCLPSGALLIDTPGMHELQLWHAQDSLENTFGDIEDLSLNCRFRDCQHQSEPGCAIQSALDAGALSPKRLHNYNKLRREQAYLQQRQDPNAQTNSKRRWKQITKRIRQHHSDSMN